MLSLTSLLPLITLLPSAFAQDGLHIRAKAAGKLYFGSATDNPELSDAPYLAGLSNTSDFGQIVAGNSMKWDATEPSRNTFSFTRGDVISDLAAKNGQIQRCHTLVWHSQLPSWVSSGTFDNATLISIIENHIANVAGHWKGKCYAWDVVNEALNEDGTYRTSVFYNTIGPAYIPIAFAAAAKADPGAKLYYNDYNLEHPGAKSTAALNIVKDLQARGIKIDGVGGQAHLIVGSVGGVSGLQTNIESFTKLGVDYAYTELDIRGPTPFTEATKAQQVADYVNVVTACKNVARCVGITIWDYTDKYSWIPSVFPGQGEALPWDKDLVKKPVYDGILNALGPKPGSGSSTSSVVVKPTSTVVPTPTRSTASVTATPTALAPRWGQCGGGSDYKGPTACVSPYVCTKQNDWYSQCL